MRVRTIAILALIAPLTALAGQGSGSHSTDMSIGVRFGTLGIGPEISKLVTPHLGLRVGANFFSASHTFKEDDLSLAATLKLKAITGLIDLYPGRRGSFHLSAGVISNPADISGTGQPNNGTYTFNHHDYPAASVGTITGTAKWPGASPYLGLGFGTPATKHSALKFVYDIGVAIGKPTVTLVASNPTNNATLAADVAAQRATIQTDANKLSVYPAISFGLVVRF